LIHEQAKEIKTEIDNETKELSALTSEDAKLRQAYTQLSTNLPALASDPLVKDETLAEI
jgi:hypothetical protein